VAARISTGLLIRTVASFPDDIDLDAVVHLVITGGLPIAEAAARLGTTGSHVRLALDRVPRCVVGLFI
jgi:hypothetical protein